MKTKQHKASGQGEPMINIFKCWENIYNAMLDVKLSKSNKSRTTWSWQRNLVNPLRPELIWPHKKLSETVFSYKSYGLNWHSM